MGINGRRMKAAAKGESRESKASVSGKCEKRRARSASPTFQGGAGDQTGFTGFQIWLPRTARRSETPYLRARSVSQRSGLPT